MTFCSLADLFLGFRAADHPVALHRGELRSWGDLRRGAEQVAAQVRAAGGNRWVLGCEETWDFTVGLFGLLLAERTPVLPPNFQPGTLARLREGADGLLGEIPAGLTAAPAEPRRLAGTLEFWTSGTTGEPKAVIKSLAQLDAEVAMLAQVFGELPGCGPMAGTVPHHHIYGCLFRLLWPLAAGRPFLCEPCGDPSSFLQAVAAAPVLVSSPAHLSRLPRLMDFSQLPARPGAVFSSGGPLSRADALEWRRWLPGGVREIYGSTESGGIAWRCQDEEPQSAWWTPLPDVALTLETDGALVVRSFRAGPELRMDDAAEWTGEGRFRLLGRLDRTIKLEEKRVSLPELEAALETHPRVVRAAVVLLQGRRPTLGAAVVLTGPADAERHVLVQALRQHLAQRFEPVALPKRWRFLASLPYDDRGKLTSRALQALFEPEAPPAPPAVLLRRSEREAVFALTLSPELPAFQGHFPGDPVLPGVVQVDWAVHLGRQAFGALGTFAGLDQVKFLEPVRPTHPLELTLTLDPGRLRFQYACGPRRTASGTIRFQEAP